MKCQAEIREKSENRMYRSHAFHSCPHDARYAVTNISPNSNGNMAYCCGTHVKKFQNLSFQIVELKKENK